MSHSVHDRESYNSSSSRQNVAGQGAINDDTVAVRASFATISLLCMLLMGALFGNRFQSLYDCKYWGSMTAIRALPYFLYCFGSGFVLASGVTVANLGLHQTTDRACKGAMYVCLVFYCGVKILVQAFLIERAHAVRHKLKKRLDDWIWILFVIITVLGFGTIVILAFRSPDGTIDPGDQQCRIGLPRVAVMVLMTWDILINISLTGTFIILLMPLLKRPKSSKAERTASRIPLQTDCWKRDSAPKLTNIVTARSRESVVFPEIPESLLSLLPPVVDRSTDHLKSLVYKTLFGTVVLTAATIINLVVLYRYHGYEHAWMCFICCLVDITWAVTIIHLLTETKKEAIGPVLARQAYSNERLQAATNERLRAVLHRPSLTRNVIGEGGGSLTTLSSL